MSNVKAPIGYDAADADALGECEREPIRTPGAIQPGGSVLIVEEDGLRVAYASANAAEHLGRSPESILGKPLGASGLESIASRALTLLTGGATARPVRLEFGEGGDRRVADLFAHRSGRHIVIELEDAVREDSASDFAAFQDDVRDTLDRFDQASDVEALLEVAVAAVHDLTGFDRVLAYRFEPDEHGVVVSERRGAGLQPFLGLHYPASDIPAQARALYREQWLRLIPDSGAQAVDLVGMASAPPPSMIDLGAAVLRAVSPVHLQYLRNMGVRASMSVSLVVNEKLWGLIVCHHYRAPRHVPYRIRAACEIVGRTASMTLGPKQALAVAEQRIELEHLRTLLLEHVADAPTIEDGLIKDPRLLLAIARASGAAIVIGGRSIMLGKTPPSAVLERVVEIARRRLAESGEWYATDEAAARHPEIAGHAECASGLLAMSLSRAREDLLVWFRPERVHEIEWAGDPKKPVEIDHRRPLEIGPRQSFARWAETVRGHSEPWGVAEIEGLASLRGTLADMLERARLFDREHHVADVIRDGLQPAPLPATPGLDLHALYLPAGAGFGVSGDFYDVIPVAGGWLASVGDVCGKGPRAARLTDLARHTIRALALGDPTISPSRLMALLHEAFLQQAGKVFATVQIARISLASDGSVNVVLCSAGHPPALHKHGSTISRRTSSSALIGVPHQFSYEDVDVVLAPGDALLMYTDGITEAGRPAAMFGEEQLARVLAECDGASAQGLIDTVEAALDRVQNDDLRDDVAMLSIRAPLAQLPTPPT